MLIQQPRAIYETNPYQPLPPPAHPILENRYAHSTLLNPNAELKLYPPVMQGISTISLHRGSPSFNASPYNTLRASSVNRSNVELSYGGDTFENPRTGSVGVGGGGGSTTSLIGSQRRAKSAGVLAQKGHRAETMETKHRI